MDLRQELRNTVQSLGKRPGMFLGEEATFKNLCIYLAGVFWGYKVCSGVHIERQISSWYQAHTTYKAPNLDWFTQI